LVLLTASLGFTACGTAHRADRASDPPVLVPWSRVGDIELGGSRLSVEREYGSVGHGFHVVQRYGAPTGGTAVEGYYDRHGGNVAVTFYSDKVGRIGFGIRYYRTKTGFGVGSTIPLGPCHKTAPTSCEHRWHGFVFTRKYHDTPCACWIKVGVQRMSLPATGTFGKQPWFFIYTRRGRVTGFYFALDFID
jgi:hypothetical protein